jgi:hypothetical protein
LIQNVLMNNDLKVSAKMAIALGIFLPVAETVRRINQNLDCKEFLSWFDDYILGAILLTAAYLVFKTKKKIAYLIAAWSVAALALLLSFIGQFSYYRTPAGDPGIFSTTFVAIAKGLILLYIVIGLTKTIRAGKAK